MTDGELVRRALEGDARAFEQLARRWAGRVLAVCHARVPRPDVVEDLAQEALLRALQRLTTLKSPESFGPWLRGIAAHVCQDWQRSNAGRESSVSNLREDGTWQTLDGDDVDGAIATDDENVRLLGQVRLLPEDLREVILLHYYDDMTYEELAAVLGVSKATVNARLAKARDTLRRQLSRSMR